MATTVLSGVRRGGRLSKKQFAQYHATLECITLIGYGRFGGDDRPDTPVGYGA